MTLPYRDGLRLLIVDPIIVTVLAPIAGTLTPASGLAATGITIGGTGLAATGFTTLVTVDGEFVDFAVVDATSVTATMPTLRAGDYDVVVSVGGVVSNALTWTQTADFDEDEPANDFGATGPSASFPMDFTGIADVTEFPQAFGWYDIFPFTLTEDGTINITLTWADTAVDLDVYIWDASLGEPDGFFGTFPTGWSCGAAGGSGGAGFIPETTGDCDLPAGDYYVWMYGFGPNTTQYTFTGTVTPDSAP